MDCRRSQLRYPPRRHACEQDYRRQALLAPRPTRQGGLRGKIRHRRETRRPSLRQEPPAMTFELGARVQWTSQAGGNTTTKAGEVVAIVPPGIYPHQAPPSSGVRWILSDGRPLPDRPARFGGGIGGRAVQSYVVIV